MAKAHFGPGFVNDAYHLLLGGGIVWMVVTGWFLYLRIRRSRKNLMLLGQIRGQTAGVAGDSKGKL